jgi:hypothetical protein
MIRQRRTFRGAKTLDVHGYGEWYFYGPECARLYPAIRQRYGEIWREYQAASIPLIRAGRARYPGKEWWYLDAELANRFREVTTVRDRAIRELVAHMREAAEIDSLAIDSAYAIGRTVPFEPCASPLEALIRYGLAT